MIRQQAGADPRRCRALQRLTGLQYLGAKSCLCFSNPAQVVLIKTVEVAHADEVLKIADSHLNPEGSVEPRERSIQAGRHGPDAGVEPLEVILTLLITTVFERVIRAHRGDAGGGGAKGAPRRI